MNEKVLTEETWPQEAQAIIQDISKHVKSCAVSETLQSTNQKIFLNLTTLEGKQYCIEVSAAGFKIVGHEHDNNLLDSKQIFTYETPYALLNDISQKYKESFGGELMSRLLDLAKNES